MKRYRELVHTSRNLKVAAEDVSGIVEGRGISNDLSILTHTTLKVMIM